MDGKNDRFCRKCGCPLTSTNKSDYCIDCRGKLYKWGKIAIEGIIGTVVIIGAYIIGTKADKNDKDQKD